MTHEIWMASLYEWYLAHPTVTTDSRECGVGALFFALRGARFDGNRYAAMALEKGCAGAVVDDAAVVVAACAPSRSDEREWRECDSVVDAGDREQLSYGPHGRYFLVPDVLAALQGLAAYHRERFRTWPRSMPVIGITGTNGKTTTKELTHAVLSRRYRVRATVGNLNNQIGVPLTLLRVTPDDEIAIVEMGANHPMDIAELCAIARPDYGLITNVGKGHLLGFGSLDGVVEAKTKLYDSLRADGGTAFVDAGNELLVPKAAGLNVIPYAVDANGGGDISALEPAVTGRVVDATGCLRVALSAHGEVAEVATHLIGAYNLANVTAAATVGLAFGIPLADIKAAIEEYVPANMRSQLLDLGHGQRIVMDAYNANPVSMRAALDSFAAFASGRKGLILGDMGELGEESQSEHLRILEYIATSDFGDVCLVGMEFTRAFLSLSMEQKGRLGDRRSVRCYETVADLVADAAALQSLPPTLLVKGSRSNALEKVVEQIKQLSL